VSGRLALAPAVYVEPDPTGLLCARPAAQSGYEGVACIDDASRLAILLMQLGLLPDVSRRLLDFVEGMQQEDGSFANFVLDWEGTPNLRGPTSYPGGLWWTARALRSLARGAHHFHDRATLAACERGFSSVSPDREFDASSQLVWGALDFSMLYGRHVLSESALYSWAESLACRSANENWLLDRIASPSVHFWGRTQEMVLATLGHRFRRPEWVEQARSSAWAVLAPPLVDMFASRASTVPYELASVIRSLRWVGLLAEDTALLRAAGVATSWFWGNNAAGAPLINHVAGGGVSDGIDGGRLSANSGAESNIETLSSLLAVDMPSSTRSRLTSRSATLGGFRSLGELFAPNVAAPTHSRRRGARYPSDRRPARDDGRRRRTMGRNDSVQRVTSATGGPAWLVSGHERVKELLADPRISRSHRDPRHAVRLTQPALFGGPMGDPETERADHVRMRRLLTRSFSVSVARSLQEMPGAASCQSGTAHPCDRGPAGRCPPSAAIRCSRRSHSDGAGRSTSAGHETNASTTGRSASSSCRQSAHVARCASRSGISLAGRAWTA